ncbi:hypothetical protein CI610_00402 [invertebrate metagenome]|uniref:Uncharacterized protein n=1 Tax=invertebrate metagenome TaxID=1711999 RepID=A0A2H9TBJ5_9ZZZZ
MPDFQKVLFILMFLITLLDKKIEEKYLYCTADELNISRIEC